MYHSFNVFFLKQLFVIIAFIYKNFSVNFLYDLLLQKNQNYSTLKTYIKFFEIEN